jgi:iron(III) transport system permease protein
MGSPKGGSYQDLIEKKRTCSKPCSVESFRVNLLEKSFFQSLAKDTQSLLRNPGLLITTSIAVILLLLFIVFPIGAVLVKSFTITFPTVTISTLNNVSTKVDSEARVTQKIVASLKPVQGITHVEDKTDEKTSVIIVSFQKNWDDLKCLNDVKRTLDRNKGDLSQVVEKISITLGKKTVNSLDSYVDFFSKKYYNRALRNSLTLAVTSTIIIIFIAFIFAFLSLNGPPVVSTPLRIVGLLPLVAPPFIFSLSLILIGGKQGLITKALYSQYHIYGWPGVILAQVITFLPLGYLMIENVLRSLDPNLDEAASDMGATPVDILFRITIPLAAPGILKAALLVFICSIADFGNPMLIGGGLSFLATDAYLLWTSENNLEMAAVFCMFLVIPSMIVFVLHEYILKGKMYTTIGGKPQQAVKRKISGKIFYPMLGFATPVSLLIVVCFGMILLGAFTKILMVNHAFTLEHFKTPNGIRSLVYSLKFALGAALIAPIIGVTLSYILVRKRIPLKKVVESIALLGFAVPGTVMGVGYILFFNQPPLKLTGTFIIMILNEAFRNLSVGLEAGVSKLHQLDIAIEEAAIDMGASTFQTFIKIVLPLISSALIAGFIYTFMVGMIAVSAVIFLISPGNYLASIYILNVAEEGFLGMACAISTMLIVVVLACLGALKLLSKYSKTAVFARGY